MAARKMPIEEIAEILGLDQATVRKHIAENAS